MSSDRSGGHAALRPGSGSSESARSSLDLGRRSKSIRAQQHNTAWPVKLNIDELKAQEITAHLRPNPELHVSADGTQVAPATASGSPSPGTFVSPGVSYLFERRNKRSLRYESRQARHRDRRCPDSPTTERTLLFNLRNAFVGVLQAKAVLRLAQDNLDYYDKILKVSRDRFQAGDIARIDLDRLELQRLQYESDLQTATVNLRTTKINLLALLDDRRPVDSFDVDGPFDFSEDLLSLDEYRKNALDARPDLRAAVLSVQQAETNYKLAEANGSTDPTIGIWFTHNGSFNNPDALNTIGASVNIPLRIFDTQPGRKTAHENRHQPQRETARKASRPRSTATWIPPTRLLSDINLLKPYKRQYLEQAVRVRDTVQFSYQHGGASLLDFLNAESEYRTVQLSYVNLVGSYLTAAAQLNLAVGREVIP